MTTIRDVARACRVSTATVSNVLNNAARPVHPETRAKVLEVARLMDYHPNAMARGLVSRRLDTFGVLFGVLEPEVVTNPYASAILAGIMTVASDCDYNVTLLTKRWQNARESSAMFRDRRADGYIVVAPPLDSDIVSGLSATGLPLVVVSSQCVPDGVPFVDIDNYRGLQLATRHMLDLGHSKIAHISGNEQQPSFAARRAGFLETMQEAGLSPPPEHLVTSWYVVERSRPDVRALLTGPNRPTAIVTASDHIACAVLEVARELGVAVPEQLSVTGFDDIPAATLVTPQLTTVRQPLQYIGQQAAILLLEQIEGRDVVGLQVGPELIVRGSTAPPPL